MKKPFLLLLNGALALLFFLTVYQSAQRTRQASIVTMQLQASLMDTFLSTEKQQIVAAFVRTDSLASDRLVGEIVLDHDAVQQTGWGATLQPTARTEAMLLAAQRGRTVVELLLQNGQPVWVVMVPDDEPNRVRTGLFRWQPPTVKKMQPYMWLEQQFVFAEEAGLPNKLPQDLQKTIFERENHWAGIARFGDETRLACAVPIKDFDAWDVTGALILMRQTDTDMAAFFSALLKPSALIGLLAMSFAGAGLTIKLCRATASKKEQSA